MWNPFKPALEAVAAEFQGRPNLRQLYMPLVAENPEPGLNGAPFIPGKSYFSVRLIELRLATAGQYLTTFLPMCTCCLSFQREGEKRSIPFIAGADMIRGLIGQKTPPDAGKRITFANLSVASNVPVPGSDVTMYLSLCRFNDSSLVRGLLSLAAKTASAVAGPAAAPIIRTATDFAGGLMDLVKSDGVETRFARLDGKALTTSGYWLLAASADPAFDAEQLVVRDGQLVRRSGGGEHTIDDVDYLVVAFEHRESLVDDSFALVSELPFHLKHWNAVKKAIVTGNAAACKHEMIELGTAITASPDLTAADQFGLVQTYQNARKQLEAQFKPEKLHKGGGDPGLFDALDRQARSEDIGSAVGSALRAAATDLFEIPAPPPPRDAEGGPGDADMAVTFRAILESQRRVFDDSEPEDLAAAARAYAAAAARD